ncbi:MAG TPA: tetratricopeptide repeat protein [Ignavibacteriaceae bacterium]|nr:tetratricopeptide repeat protein [Ignavibacteriaceae bacterium]
MIKEAQHSIEKVLESYFKKEEISEYKKLLKQKPSEAELVSSLTHLNKAQLSSTFTSGSEYQLKVNLLITFAKDKLDDISYPEFLIQLADTSIIQGEFNIAIQILNNLLELIEKRDDLNPFKAQGYYLLATIYSRLSEWTKSITTLNKAKQLYEKEKDFRGYVRCENLLGVIHLDYGKLDRAAKHFENCLSHLNINNDTGLMGMIEINLGVVNGMKGSYEDSYNYFHRALIKFNKLNNILRIIELRHNLALLHVDRGEYRLALGEIDQSISFAQKVNYISNLAISYLTKALIYIQLNDLVLANGFSDKSLELSYKLNDRLTVADNFKLKGIIERTRGNYKLAEIHLLTSLRINEELSNQLNYAETMVELGILYQIKKMNDKAEECFKSALNYYRRIKHSEKVQFIKQHLTELSAGKNK